jgi:CubicO group peptidase (beta-lactamase class C family)
MDPKLNESKDSLECRLRSLLRRQVADRILSSAVARLDDLGDAVDGPHPTHAVASAAGDARGYRCSRFDLASITKPFVGTLALRLDRDGILPLTVPLHELEARLPATAGRRVMRDLLCHQAGLLPWAPLYALQARHIAERIELLCEPRWWTAELDTYSDLGFILWSALAERAIGASLWDLLKQQVIDPLGLDVVVQSMLAGATAPAPRSADHAGTVSCSLDTDREVELAARLGIAVEPLGPPASGTSQDGNARFLGGLPGHAGLFASADGVAGLLREWLRLERILDAPMVQEATRPASRFALGWWRCEPDPGRPLLVHDGFVGGTVWLDFAPRRCGVLLGYRCNLRQDLSELRREFARLGGGAPGPG